MKTEKLRTLLDEALVKFNTPEFIPGDPISIPHSYSENRDIEISGLFAAILAWGNRTTIINNCRKLMQLMDNAPYQFITGHSETDLQQFQAFTHRTFNSTDLLYFIHFLRKWYSANNSLEPAFAMHMKPGDTDTGNALTGFHKQFFDDAYAPARTRKHISTPEKKSACKRLNMYLRWMVRKDSSGVDFGIWNSISPVQLVCPLDLHVERVARKYGLISRKQVDWQAALELTAHLKKLDPFDPVKYDFALFGLSAMQSERAGLPGGTSARKPLP
jgi:uncharacterized protein (TIGR02757 family)